MNDENIDLLAKYDVRIATNIYSRKKEIHDGITKLKGSLEHMAKTIKKIDSTAINL